MDAVGYPTDDTVAFARHASVSSYVENIRVPTLLIQGENDTLFNLQEAVATYQALQAQGTETKMIWQSWGHSGAAPAPGELDMRHPEQSYEGARVISWFQRYLEDKPVDTGPEFSYFRDWVSYSGIATPAYGTSSTYPVGKTQQLYLSGTDKLVTAKSSVVPGSATYANVAGAAPLSYSEVSALQGDPIPERRDCAVRHPGELCRVEHRAARQGRCLRGHAAADACVSRLPLQRRHRAPARPANCCCSRRSMTSPRTALRRLSTGSSRRPASPMSPNRW